TWNRMDGGIGNALLRDGDFGLNTTVPVANPAQTPSGAKGRIVLATPFATGQRGLDLYYQNWLYALVATPGGRLDGLYVTNEATPAPGSPSRPTAAPHPTPRAAPPTPRSATPSSPTATTPSPWRSTRTTRTWSTSAAPASSSRSRPAASSAWTPPA